MFELTKRANARLLRINHLCGEAVALADATVGRISALRRLLNNSPPDASSIEFEISRLQGSLSDHKMHSDSLQQLIAQLNAWQQTLKFPVIDAAPVKVRLGTGESVLSKLSDIRRHIAELAFELKTAQRAAPTVEEQKAAADAWLANLPTHSRPRIKAHKHDFFSMEFSDPTSHTVRLPIASVLYWMDPEAFRARIHTEIEALPKPALVLSAEKQAERIAELRALLLHAEREEAALIEYAESEGQRIVFRPFISALALLGLAIKQNGQRAAA
jgi:hypothetical protein